MNSVELHKITVSEIVVVDPQNTIIILFVLYSIRHTHTHLIKHIISDYFFTIIDTHYIAFGRKMEDIE